MSAKLTNDQISEMDKKIAEAKARKAKRESAEGTTETPAKPAKAPKAAKEPAAPKRPKLTDEEKAARQAKRDEERAARKTAREAARAEKKAEREANKKPAHMKKVAKAAEKLGSLEQAALLLFNEATANLTQSQLAQLALHIQHFNRVKATERALTQKVEAGAQVRIVGGDPRWIGKTGTVAKAQRIRCYVKVDGAKEGAKDVYLFTSDVEVQDAAAATEPEAAVG